MRLTFLGTRGEIDLRRRRHWRHSSLLISHLGRRVMVDCGADWLRLIRRIAPHAIVLTHAHPDHAFGLARGAPCPVWATAACWSSLTRFPIADRRTVKPRRPFVVEGIRFTAFPVEHSVRAPAVGYRFGVARGIRIFYAPDLVFIIDRVSALRGVSLYIGDGATLTRPLVRQRTGHLIGHAPITTQLSWCGKEGVPRAIITHCGTSIVQASHTTVSRRLDDLGARHGVAVELAYDGMTRVVR